MNKYKSVLLATASGIAFVPTVHAADLPLKAAYTPAVAPAAPSWQGLYAGVNLGVAWEQGENRVGGAGYKPDNTAFIGGGQIGYNWQRGNFVYGVEADIAGLSSKNTQTTYPGSGYLTYGNHISWLSTVRGRMGLAVNDTMVYATAGLAIGGVKNTHFWDLAAGEDYSTSKTRVGWTAGLGIEHMWNRNWTIGLETLFVDLGRYTTRKDNWTNHFSNQAILTRFKLNYKF